MFQETIRREAKRQKLSGYALAKLIGKGLSMRSVQMYLAGKHDLSGERVALIAKALGMELRTTRKGR